MSYNLAIEIHNTEGVCRSKLHLGHPGPYSLHNKVENFKEDSFDSIPSPSVKIQINGGQVYSR